MTPSGLNKNGCEGTGKLVEGLYHLKRRESVYCLSIHSDSDLVHKWHMRLGHVPFRKFICITKLNCKHFLNVQCDICP